MNDPIRKFIKINYTQEIIKYKVFHDKDKTSLLSISFERFYNYFISDTYFKDSLINFPEDFLEYIKLKYE